MKTCKLIVRDAVNVRLEGLDLAIRKRLSNELKFFIPSARHTPQFKLGRWDGTVRFCSEAGNTYLNLLHHLLPILDEENIEITVDDRRPQYAFTIPPVIATMFADHVWPDDHRLAGQPIVMLDHQVEVTNRFLNNLQSIQVVATSAGKTVICAALSKQIEPYGRSLIIVPNTNLVRQTCKLYRNVGLDVGVYHGEEKDIGHQHQICTWQSLGAFAKRDSDSELTIMQFIEGVTCVIVDETHTAAANVLKGLLCGPFANIPIRWGLTGTIQKEEHLAVSLCASIGPLVGVLPASELQEIGILADCSINIIETDDSHVEFDDYDSEHKFLMTDSVRLQWLANFIQEKSEGGSTLVLVDRIETGKKLVKLLPDAVFVSGQVKTKAREKEYSEVHRVDGKIIIATYGVAAVGLDIPRLFHCVLISPGKSFVRIIQSIGRMLRLAADKNSATIHDITSSLKYSKRHITKHKEYYREAGYPFTMSKVKYDSGVITMKKKQ